MQTNSISISPEVQANLPLVADGDHPLSLGYKIYLLTDSAFAAASSRASAQLMKKVMGDLTFEGLHATWNGSRRMVVIVIQGSGLPPLRLVELIVHEISHCVDAIFDRCEIDEVDTEIRAYMNDWLVGKTLHHFNLFLSAPCEQLPLTDTEKDALGLSSGYCFGGPNHRQADITTSDSGWASAVPSGLAVP